MLDFKGLSLKNNIFPIHLSDVQLKKVHLSHICQVQTLARCVMAINYGLYTQNTCFNSSGCDKHLPNDAL